MPADKDALLPTIGRIEHETLQERVYGALREAFLNGRFTPGQLLTMRGLADLTGTSVQPVREALQRLCAEGALEWLPNKAFRVPEVDPKRYRELWDVRKLLEGYATRLAAVKISDPQIKTVRQLNRQLQSAIESGAADEALSCNREFHFTIYRASESPVLVNLIEMIWLQVSPLIAAYTQHEAANGEAARLAEAVELEQFYRLQDELIAALAEHQPKAAERALHGLLELSTRLFLPNER